MASGHTIPLPCHSKVKCSSPTNAAGKGREKHFKMITLYQLNIVSNFCVGTSIGKVNTIYGVKHSEYLILKIAIKSGYFARR